MTQREGAAGGTGFSLCIRITAQEFLGKLWLSGGMWTRAGIVRVARTVLTSILTTTKYHTGLIVRTGRTPQNLEYEFLYQPIVLVVNLHEGA